LLQTASVLHERLEKRRELLSKYGLTDQPIFVVVGPLEAPTQCIVAVDNFHYDVKSPLEAVDVVFKIFEREVSTRGGAFVAFLQRGVYGIKTRSDRHFTPVVTRLKELRRFGEK